MYALLVGGAIILLTLIPWRRLFVFRSLKKLRRDHGENFWLQLHLVISKSRTFNELLDSCFCLLINEFGAESGFVSVISRCQGRLEAVATFGENISGQHPPAEGNISDSVFRSNILGGRPGLISRSCRSLSANEGKGHNRQWLGIPIVLERKSIALIGLYIDRRFANGIHQSIDPFVVQEVISSAAASFLAEAVGAIHQTRERRGKALERELATCSRIREGLEKLVSAAIGICPVEFISLARVNQLGGDEIRWCADVAGENLKNWQFPIIPAQGRRSRAIDWIDHPVIDGDLSASSRPEAVFETCREMRSRLVLPLADHGLPRAALTLAHRNPNQYDEIMLNQLDALAAAFARWLGERDAELAARRNWLYLQVLDRLERFPKDVAPQLPSLLRDTLAVTTVRFYQFDPIGQQFVLAQSSSYRPDTAGELMGKSIPAQKLVLHRRTIEEQSCRLVDQKIPALAMPEPESGLLGLGPFKTGLLVPWGERGNGQGILSVTEMRHPARRRLAEQDRAFLHCVAPHVSAVLSGKSILIPKNRIKPALTAPLMMLDGSMELIRQQQKPPDPGIEQYLSNIERATKRIREFAEIASG